ncbi:galactinol--sucrose galactosyltransferase [Ranunculus cassubicifolius]
MRGVGPLASVTCCLFCFAQQLVKKRVFTCSSGSNRYSKVAFSVFASQQVGNYCQKSNEHTTMVFEYSSMYTQRLRAYGAVREEEAHMRSKIFCRSERVWFWYECWSNTSKSRPFGLDKTGRGGFLLAHGLELNSCMSSHQTPDRDHYNRENEIQYKRIISQDKECRILPVIVVTFLILLLHLCECRYVYVWHALAGYWGGVKPAGAGMEHYDSALAYPVQSPGVERNQPDIVMDSLSVLGLGLVPPKKVFDFYNELHSYLASCGVDGVKVDVQNIIETLGAGHGGRVSLTRSYQQALEASISRNFVENACIACMCHNTDGLYSAKQTAVVRASDDFYPHDPASHTIHISSVAYNTLFLGEFMHPDWDMFHSLHPAADYHAAARSIGGCAIYVSDKPGNHNFELLKKLVLPDGSVLRAQLPGKPTRDCLFADPARDGISLLKIWNLNKCSGVVGVFNCQGAGWCKVAKRTLIHDTSPGTLTSTVCTTDVDLIEQVAGTNWNGEAAVYGYRSGELIRLAKGSSLPVTLEVLEYELFHFSPIKEIEGNISFAPIGLVDMFNSSGAVERFEVQVAENKPELFGGEVSSEIATATILLEVRGCGRFGAYSSRSPLKCSVEGSETSFDYNSDNGLLIFSLPVPEKEMYR